MSPVLSRSRPPALGAPRRRGAAVAAVAVAAAVLAVAIRVLPQPLATGSLTVANPHPWLAVVDIGPTRGATRVAVGSVPRGQSHTFVGVPDDWDDLTLTYSYAGVSVQQQVARDQVEAAGLRVEVPAAFAVALTEAGVAPTAPAG